MNLYTKQKQTHRHRKQTYGYRRGKGGELGVQDEHTHTTFKIDKQHRPTVQHRELYSIFCNNLYGKRNRKGMDIYIYICITESLSCTLKTNTTL